VRNWTCWCIQTTKHTKKNGRPSCNPHTPQSRRWLSNIHAQWLLNHRRSQWPHRSLAERRNAGGSHHRGECTACRRCWKYALPSPIYDYIKILTSTAPGPKERHLETLLHNTLHSLILTRLIPRTLVQITLQVRSLPEEDGTTGVNSVCSLPFTPYTQSAD
jgi:hypothetical protein